MNQDDNPFRLKVYPRHMKHLEVILMMMMTTVTCLLEIIKSLFIGFFYDELLLFFLFGIRK
jgi:hypothetical protein